MLFAALPVKTIADDWKYFTEQKHTPNLQIVYPFPILHAELLSAVNKKKYKQMPLRTKLKYFIYNNRIFPLYQVFLWVRRRSAEAIQRKNIITPQINYSKTYKL